MWSNFLKITGAETRRLIIYLVSQHDLIAVAHTARVMRASGVLIILAETFDENQNRFQIVCLVPKLPFGASTIGQRIDRRYLETLTTRADFVESSKSATRIGGTGMLRGQRLRAGFLLFIGFLAISLIGCGDDAKSASQTGAPPPTVQVAVVQQRDVRSDQRMDRHDGWLRK